VNRKRLRRLRAVTLQATNTNATVKFLFGSPFQSGRTNFLLRQGDPPHPETIGGTTGVFEYALNCSRCPSPSNPPAMIVDP
jgi:hypothetical protein